MGFSESDPRSQLSLPPGFRFYPTDEELLVQYLCRKVAGHHFSLQIIGEVDLYKYDPWVLPSMATFGEKEWYFFSPRDRKYPNGSRPNRVAGSGYWKATGTDKLITTEGRKVGIKKALVFYVGKAPKGTKTNWIMHEYRLLEPSRKHGSSKLDDWVLCRIYKKNSSAQKTASSVVSSMEQYSNGCSSSSSSSHRLDDMLESLPEAQGMTSLHKTSSSNQEDYKPLPGLQGLNSGNFDWASLAALNSFPELVHSSHHHNHNLQTQQQTQGTLSFNANNMQCFPSTPQQQLGRVEEEVQSGNGGQQRVRVGNPGFAQPELNRLNHPELETSQYSNGLDPFGFRYPSLPTGFGFRP